MFAEARTCPRCLREEEKERGTAGDSEEEQGRGDAEGRECYAHVPNTRKTRALEAFAAARNAAKNNRHTV